MICTLIRDKDDARQFRVEAVDKDGGCEVAIFCGPNAVGRAIAFASAPGGYYDGWNDPEDWFGKARRPASEPLKD